MYKQHQVVLVATNQSKLFIFKNNQLYWDSIGERTTQLNQSPQHIYLLSEEKIEVGDWYYCSDDSFGGLGQHTNQSHRCSNCKKIIASTDKSLSIDIIPTGFKSGVGALSHKQTKPLLQIPQSFIKYFITEFNKGHIIDKVNVEYINLEPNEQELILSINQSNEINIKPIKEFWSREEVESLIEKGIKQGIRIGKTSQSVIEQFERKQDYINNLKLDI